jgi:hypothetical protein
VNTENILVPFDRNSSGLKSLYHAFALAERITAKVVVLIFKDGRDEKNTIMPLEKACKDMVQSACEQGLSVSFHIVYDGFESEFVNIIKKEHIDLIVLNASDMDMKAAIKPVKTAMSLQIIEVREKQ